jgi:ketosteroid isomerase-like protein
VVVVADVHARGRGSGVELDQVFAWVGEFRDGSLVRLQTFVDREEALAAGGVR